MYNRFRKKPDCGTRAGYDYHVRQAKENPCEECRESNKAYFKKTRFTKNKNRKSRLQRNRKIAWTLILELYGDVCYLCNQKIDLLAPRQVGKLGWELSFHPDHVIPLSKGGLDIIDNMRPTHAICNQKKSNKVITIIEEKEINKGTK